MRKGIAALSVMAVCAWIAQAQEGHHHELTEQEVGSVHFATTCSEGMSEPARAEFDASFNKAVALLHSFQYEDTRRAFEAIAKKKSLPQDSREADEKLYLKRGGSRSLGTKALTRVEAGARLRVSPGKLEK